MFKRMKIAFAALLALVAAPVIASAQLQWTTNASTCTVYPPDMSKVSIGPEDPGVSISYPNTGFVRLSYNLPLPSCLLQYSNTAMAVRFRDAGNSGDWIIVRLKEFNPTTGLTYTRMTFNSNSFTPSSWNQEQWVYSTYDFDPYKVYYLQAEVYRSTLTFPPPILYSIRLWRY